MLLPDETNKKYGYFPISLGKASNKYVVLKCDYCDKVCEKKNGKYNQGRKTIEKDCCNDVNCMKRKREESMLKTYGVKTVGETEGSHKKRTREENVELYRKRSATMKKNLGVDNVFQLESVKGKIRATNLENFGVEYPSQSPEIRRKQEDTLFKNHGVKHALQKKEFRDKANKTTLERHGSESFAKTEAFRDICKEKRYKFNGKTYKEIAEETGKAYTTVVEQINEYGYEYALSMSKRISSLELRMEDFLKTLSIEYKSQLTIAKYRPDFLIKDIIIEVNGNYWHSDSILKDDKYHANKRKFYKENKLQSLFFFEDEINNKFEIVKSIIRNKLKLSERIFARKCRIDKVTKVDSNQFLTDNHLMGKGKGDSIGLYHDNELVCIMRFINKSGVIDISRFCTKLNTSVVGGFSRLLKFMISDIKPSKVVNFVDMCYGSGSYLKNYGFVLESKYLSFKWTDYKNRYHRMKFPSNSGYEHGLHKIWDCGQAKYVLNIEQTA